VKEEEFNKLRISAKRDYLNDNLKTNDLIIYKINTVRSDIMFCIVTMALAIIIVDVNLIDKFFYLILFILFTISIYFLDNHIIKTAFMRIKQ